MSNSIESRGAAETILRRIARSIRDGVPISDMDAYALDSVADLMNDADKALQVIGDLETALQRDIGMGSEIDWEFGHVAAVERMVAALNWMENVAKGGEAIVLTCAAGGDAVRVTVGGSVGLVGLTILQAIEESARLTD